MAAAQTPGNSWHTGSRRVLTTILFPLPLLLSLFQAAAHVLAVLDAILESPQAYSETGSPSLTVTDSQRRTTTSSSSRSRGTVGFCLVRPPGHHVLPTRPMGFGLVNLVSMAVQHALTKQGQNIKKVRPKGSITRGWGNKVVGIEKQVVPPCFCVMRHRAGLSFYSGLVFR